MNKIVAQLRNQWQNHRIRTIIIAVVLASLIFCCPIALLTSSEDETAEPTSPPTSVAQADTPTEPPTTAPTNTPTPEPTPTPTPPPTPTPAPTEPSYSDPIEVLTVEATGETVTDNYEMPECFKAVFDWHTEPNNYGSASLILKLHSVATEKESTLVNEFGQSAQGLDGETLQPLAEGEFFFSSENTGEPWRVTLICEDNVAPAAVGELDVEGHANLVSKNYRLPACTKSVFNYTVQPNENGSASLILYLCNVERERCQSIVNKFEMDLSGPLEGKAVESLSEGTYFLVTENASGCDWHITWECQD
jgi:hypothetical protein